MNYSIFDQALDKIELALKKLVKVHGIRQAKIERWRQDIPEITLTWQGADMIWRGITMYLSAPGEGHVEVKAWNDCSRQGGWIRQWQHEYVQSGSVKAEAWCTAAYTVVVNWTAQMLTREVPLS